MGYRIVVRDKDLNRIGEIDTWISLDFVVEFCDQGSWQLLVKSGTPQADLLQQGGGVAIFQDGVAKPVLTGQIESFQKYWTVEQHTGQGSVYVGGKTDNKLAYQRLAFPEPSSTVSNQYSGRSVRGASGPAAQAVWWEIEHSMGSSALADRQVPGLNMPAKGTAGTTVSDSLRYDVIGEKLSAWCQDNSAGYRFLWNPDTKSIDFSTFAPADKSKAVRFSPELGNLREYTWTLTAPKVTRVIVACQGDGKARYIWQKADTVTEAEWGLKIEGFVDRRDIPLATDSSGNPILVVTTDDNGIEDIGQNPDGAEWTFTLTTARAAYSATPNATTLANLKAAIKAAKPVAVAYYVDVVKQAADEALAEGAKSGNFQIYPIDTEQIKFGRDYFVGDMITVDVDGESYTDIVRAVTISVDDGGNTYSVAPNIGEQGTDNPLNVYKTVYEMRKKLRKLEARM
ncbi:siphovirus ReqiPepy6 Gp37-like family protein [Streptomyces sp. NBC_01197]|uniref:siphovirus ReqiPepy6 Gp37-like family protein n=1 Tax=Streptomyces sp. NBC_01197 TaxID=2903768 RepID=UPI002E11AC37|nr:siphovirus ReqiPepy6 Gp37-like family protein [Streptomyces sp. NBC_01197]